MAIEPSATPLSRSKRIGFRLFAVALALLPFLGVEILLRWQGVGGAEQQTDPFIGFRGSRPLFVLNPDQARFEIPPARQLCFRPESFGATKGPREFRIFCLGGSTVQGRPYAIETSFTTWFELSLQLADATRQFEVVNCGGISYASYRLVPILEEVLGYQPDLIVLYTGHNEFLEERTYQHIKSRGAAREWVLRQATRSRSFNVAWSTWNRWRAVSPKSLPKTLLPDEVEARLDYLGGLEQYHRDADWTSGVVAHFEFNLRRMIALCRRANVPLWIVDPVSNLRNCPPFKSEHRAGLSVQDRQRWEALRSEASERYGKDLSGAIELLEQANRIDDQHAGLVYDLAKSYDSAGRIQDAKAAYRRAKELDVCPLRVTEPLREVLQRVCAESNTPLIDVVGLFEHQSRDGIPGGFLLVDHVHPSITGHQMIADLLLDRFLQMEQITLPDDWESQRAAVYAAHSSSLDDVYYLEAQRRLEGLRKWAQGRATQPRDADSR